MNDEDGYCRDGKGIEARFAEWQFSGSEKQDANGQQYYAVQPDKRMTGKRFSGKVFYGASQSVNK